MMNRQTHESVTAEIQQVHDLLEKMPTGRILERRGLEHRLKRLQEQAGSILVSKLPRSFKVTFRGKPVSGTESIRAGFAAEVTGKLNEAVRAIASGMKSDDLSSSGRFPGTPAQDMLLSGIARGSFGFEFQIPKNGDDADSGVYDGLNDTEAAIDRLCALLRVSATDESDEQLADIINEIHPRTANKVRDFLKALQAQQALCALEFNDQVFRFTHSRELDRSVSRLDETNITESKEVVEGEVQGALPKGRTVEFLVSKTGEVIRAKVGPAIEDPDVLNRAYLHKPATATMTVTRVGQGRPRYVLETLPSLAGS